MPRYVFQIEYHGGPFVGWQRQPNALSVQGVLETALTKLDPDCQSIAGAGRTDAGVHAMGQVAHADLAKDWDAFRLIEALNFHLKPHPVSILRAAQVAEDFHSRFSAIKRRYFYRLVSRRAPLTHDHGLVWRVPHELDAAAMKAGAAHLIGNHDFTTFRSSICQSASPVKTLDSLKIEEVTYPGGKEFRFHVQARSFLHNQVRSFVGTLERVGSGAWPTDQVRQALQAKDRAACGPVAPAQGLYLAEVTYPTDPFAQT